MRVPVVLMLALFATPTPAWWHQAIATTEGCTAWAVRPSLAVTASHCLAMEGGAGCRAGATHLPDPSARIG